MVVHIYRGIARGAKAVILVSALSVEVEKIIYWQYYEDGNYSNQVYNIYY